MVLGWVPHGGDPCRDVPVVPCPVRLSPRHGVAYNVSWLGSLAVGRSSQVFNCCLVGIVVFGVLKSWSGTPTLGMGREW